MRCRDCNIDLGEAYTACPLCGARAFDDAPLLCGIDTAPYPDYRAKNSKVRRGCDFPQKYVLRAAVPLCAALGIASLFGCTRLWSCAVPAVMSAVCLFYLISGIAEHGKLLRSAVALLACAGVELVILIISAFTRCGLVFNAVCVGIGLICLAVLAAVKPRRMYYQLKAFFHL